MVVQVLYVEPLFLLPNSFRGEWGRICADNWDYSAATVACKHLGYPLAISNSTDSSQSNGTVWMMSAVECTGLESSLDGCSFKGWNVGNCSHGSAAVSCGTLSLSETYFYTI